MVVWKIATSPFLGVTVFVALIALLSFYFKFDPGQRLFSPEELALYNGTDEGLPILLGIIGSVFDVTKGKSHYGSGGGYNHFAGRDASRAFVSGNFTGEGLTDSLRGLSSTEDLSSGKMFGSAKVSDGLSYLEDSKVTDLKLPSLCEEHC